MGQRTVIEKLKLLTKEVAEIHPILDLLFSKMQSIKSVDYTHGQTEMGADFILTKLSEELGDTEYVGVIAKVGAIKQDHSDIKRQIEECQVRRFAINGKREIFLSEIWVVANGSISKGAQEKIYNSYRSQNIKFIDINKLAFLVDKYIPNYDIDVGVRENELLAIEGARAASRDARFSLLSSEYSDIYIEQDIIKIESGRYKNKRNRKDNSVNIYDEIQFSNVISIQSQMGGGKSKLLNRIILHYSNPEVYENEKLLPIYFHCSDFIEYSSIEAIEEKIVEDHKLPEDKTRKFLILVDGLDESKIANTSHAEHLTSLLLEARDNPNIKLIITSRPISNDDLESQLATIADQYQINPLSTKLVIGFIESICKRFESNSRLVEDLKKSTLFQVLPKTPIAAILLAKLLDENQDELPSNITELYSKYTELSLGRWDNSKGFKSQIQFEALNSILSCLSIFMLENELLEISIDEGKRFFKEYLDERNLDIDCEELFNELFIRSDILYKNKSTISFKHKSFAEYFYACALVNSQTEMEIDAIYHPYWVNSYFFYVGLKRDCPELLRKMINSPIKNEGQRFSRIINLGNFLLAGYASPYAVIEEGIKTIFDDASLYCEELIDNSITSPLSKFPQMHLLAIFRHILSSNYSYSFFREAISSNLLEIMTNPKNSVSKGYNLFFLDVALAELGGDVLLENTIEKYGDELPLPIQIAIGYEAKNYNFQSSAIKKLERRLIKHRRTSRSFNQTVKNLYNDAIDTSIKLPTKKR